MKITIFFLPKHRFIVFMSKIYPIIPFIQKRSCEEIAIQFLFMQDNFLIIHFNTISVADFNPQHGLFPCEEWTKSTYFTGLQVSLKERHAGKTAKPYRKTQVFLQRGCEKIHFFTPSL